VYTTTTEPRGHSYRDMYKRLHDKGSLFNVNVKDLRRGNLRRTCDHHPGPFLL